jgi:hypothetical protein
MKKAIFASALALAMVAGAQAEPLGYPGSNWSVLTVNPSPIRGTPEDNNVLLQGKIEQGVDWMRLGDGKWRLNSYVQLGYSADKNGLAYNNKLVPAIGTKVSRDFDNGVLDLGVQVVHQNNFRGVTTGPSSGTGVQLYASYWFGWNLKK